MSDTFDHLTRQMGQAASRREGLRVLGTGLLGMALGAFVTPKATAQPTPPVFPRVPVNPRPPLGPPRPFPGPGPRPVPIPLEPVGKTCSSALLRDCLTSAEGAYSFCATTCNGRGICGPAEQYPNRPLTLNCEACRRLRPDCQATLLEANSTCQRNFGCVDGYSCTVDEVTRVAEYCCRPGQAVCNGKCVEPCTSILMRRNTTTCACECATVCRPPLVQGADCTCKCPECGPGFRLQNPRTCECTCLDGLSLCGDNCVSLYVDRMNCGACGTQCAPGEECCSGQCSPMSEDPNCGRCLNNCSARGMACCPPDRSQHVGRHYCSDLLQNFDCGACGRHCGTDKCCSGACCNFGSSCCNGVSCTPLNTIQNCGSCGRRCASGEMCCNGVCTRVGTNQNCSTCGDICHPSVSWQVVDTGEVITTLPSTCKNRACACPPNSASCDNHCAPQGWICNGRFDNGQLQIARCPNGSPTGREWGTGAIICCTGRIEWIGDSRVCNRP